jgi:hypothetical protein
VLLNLVLGLSRVWLAMGRQGDMPPELAGPRPFLWCKTRGPIALI